MKKKIGFLLLLIIIWFFWKNYRVMNVYDEMALSVGRILPYTITDYRTFKAEYQPRNVLQEIDAKTEFVTNNNVSCTIYDSLIGITSSTYVSSDVYVSLHYQYNLWSKTIQPYITVYSCQNGKLDKKISDELLIAGILEEKATTVEKVQAELDKNINEVLEQWIDSNEGKTKYSKEDMGYIKYLNLSYVF